MTVTWASPPTVRVVLVEDHALIRSAVRQALTCPGLEVVGEADDAETALRIVPELRPDVVLLDINLPGMNGFTLLRELGPTLPGTKFIMLTVSTSDRDVLEAIRAGAAGFLTKDLAPDGLRRAVKAAAAGELAMARQTASRLIRALAVRAGRGVASEGLSVRLSPREGDVLRGLAAELSDRQIAEQLGISTRTVETHVANILRKLGVRKRGEAARLYLEAGPPR